jgi:hypothetical protein
MTTTPLPADPDGQPVMGPPGGEAMLVPVVNRRGRPLRAYVVQGDRVRFQPVVDVGHLLLGAAGLVVVGAVVLDRRRRTPRDRGGSAWARAAGAGPLTLTPALRPGQRPW